MRRDTPNHTWATGSRVPSGPLEIGAEVDVRALMSEIQAEVERKRAAGAYPPVLMAELDSVYGEEVSRGLAEVRQALLLSPDQPISSHRRLLGPPLVLGKRAIRRLLRWHTRGISQQSQAIGGSASRALDALTQRLQALEKDVAALRECQGPAQASPVRGAASGRDTDTAIDYVAFEDRFRGSREELAARQAPYVELFRHAGGRVLDVGCGRGEFLCALRDEGIDAYGLDYNPDMVALCHRSSLDVVEGDVLQHLRGLRADTLGGLFCAQVLEHLDARSVVGFFIQAARVIRPGGVLVAETLNPQSLCTFAGPLYVDLDHTQPLHPQTLTFLAESAGFDGVEVHHTSPMPPEFHLQQMPAEGLDPSLGGLLETLDANFHKLDELIYGHLDFALVARAT